MNVLRFARSALGRRGKAARTVSCSSLGGRSASFWLCPLYLIKGTEFRQTVETKTRKSREGISPLGLMRTRLKMYGGEVAEVMVFDKPTFNPYHVENPSHVACPQDEYEVLRVKIDGGSIDENGEITLAGDVDNLKRAKRRARTAVFDYAMCNPDLDTFITLTLNGEFVDRYDYNAVVKRLNVWLDNRVRRHGLKYIMVAERHKDGAIHFHGLVNHTAVKLENSGKKDKRRHVIYNVTDWTLGFTTAVRVWGDRANVCKYIVKYITKGEQKVGGRWYYSGGDLCKPSYTYTNQTDVEKYINGDFERYEVELKGKRGKVEIYSRLWGKSCNASPKKEKADTTRQ